MGHFVNDTNTESTIIRQILQVVIVTAAVGLPVFFYTPLDWKVQLAITGLVFLLMVQLQFIISRTRIGTSRLAPRKASKKAPSLPAVPPPEGKTGVKGQPIDPSVFSKFQKNLTQSTDSRTGETKEQEDVVVSLSSKSKSKNLKKPPKTPQEASTKGKAIPPPKTASDQPKAAKKSVGKKAEKIPEDISVSPIGSIFDDIAETPEISTGKVDPVKLPAKKLEKLSSSKEPQVEDQKADKDAMGAPLTSNEVLTQNDFETNTETAQDEAEITLTLAKRYFKKKQYEKSLSALQQILDDTDPENSNPEMMLELVQLKGECELELQQFENSSNTFQDLFKDNIDNQHPQYLDRLEQIIGRFVDADQQQYAVHFLFTALNEFRQLHEFHKMDEIYTEIESAYNQKKDLPRLTQTYQNHLAIKKTIKDFKGQLDILDHLGKLLYDQGDDEGSRKCYEQRLAVENQMEKS